MENSRLPTFIIGGAPRSGTTFLCHVLDKHPDVYIAKPYTPEPKVCLIPSKTGIEGYRQRYNDFFSEAKDQKAFGEKSSAYFENQHALETLQSILGNNTQFLFILREPVKRAYSNYLRSMQNGLEKLSFADAVKNEGKRIDPFPPEKSYVRPFDYLIRGNYATFAERYITAFGYDKIHFVFFENIMLSPDTFYRDIQTFIGVDPLPRAVLETDRVNANEKNEPPLDTLLETELREKMRPQMERFAQLTGLDVGIWGY